MKKIKVLLSMSLLAGALFLSSFTFAPKQEQQHMRAAIIRNYAWYTPDGQFIAWSTLANALVVSGDDLNPTNGTLDTVGYTGGGPGLPPVGSPVYLLYRHP